MLNNNNLIGKTINNYRIISQIGEGGMGVVYLAVHNQLDRKAAIKVLNENFFFNDEIKHRFNNEANILSKFSHPNIVTVYDFLIHQNQFLLIMEYIEGTGMDEFINNLSAPPSESITRIIFSQILDAFHYSHQNNIVHRDIKPSNIILQNDYKVKILDFGIVKNLNNDFAKTKTGMKMGSVLYMSPEQILGREIDQRSDIYSIGITFYEFLTKKNPYDTPNISEFEIQSQIINQDINVNLIPDKYKSIVLKAIAKDPNHRYNSCMEFKDDLENAENSKFAAASNSSRFAKTSLINNSSLNANQNYQAGKSNGTKIILASAGVLLVIAIIVFFVFFNNDNTKSSIDSSVTKTENTKKSELEGTNSNNSDNQLKQKELELKEQELKLKEKELNQRSKEETSNRTPVENYNRSVPGRYPEGSERYLSSADIQYMSKAELEIMRNEIFARHGYIFTKNEKMIKYFNNQPWYNPSYYDVNNMLSKIEKDNVALIKLYEK